MLTDVTRRTIESNLRNGFLPGMHDVEALLGEIDRLAEHERLCLEIVKETIRGAHVTSVVSFVDNLRRSSNGSLAVVLADITRPAYRRPTG